MDITALAAILIQQSAAQTNVALDLIKQNAATDQAIADVLLEAIAVTPSGRGTAVNLAA